MQDLANKPQGIFQSVLFWQACTVGALLAALYAFAGNLDFPDEGPNIDYVAIVGGNDAEPLWVVSANLGEGMISARSVRAEAADDAQYQLWLVPGNGDPIALGTLPVGGDKATMPIDDALAAILRHGRTVGVTRAAAGAMDDEPPTEFLHRANVNRI